MKNYKLLTLALGLAASSVFALTADQYVTNGLASLVAKDMAGAYSNFNAAVTSSSTNETANALLAVTRLLVLPQQPAGSNLLNSLGFSPNGRNIYNWTSAPPVDLNGEITLPTNNTSVAIAFYRTNIILALGASLTNLSRITDPAFTLSLTADETSVEAVTVDYGDFLLMQAELYAAEFLGYTLNAQNCNVVLRQLQLLSETNGFSIQTVLADYPSLLTQNNAADLPNSKAALTNAIMFYLAASDFIRNTRTPGQGLFLLDDPKAIAEEAIFRDSLTNVLLSVNGPVQFNPDMPGSLDLSNYFAGTKTLRSLLPQFSGSRYVVNTLPDYSFGGILLGEPACNTEVLLRRHIGQNFSGIYTGQTYDNYFSEYVGSFAIIVNSSQQATVVGDDPDQQPAGLFAQFNLDQDGNCQFTSNNVTGYGSFSTDGSFSLELDYTNGVSVYLSSLSGYLLSPYGSVQNGAGYYTGSYSGSHSGTLKVVVGADSEVFICSFVNGIAYDGGYGLIDSTNHFTGFTDNSGSALGGTYNPSSFTIAGNYTNTDNSTGSFTVSRSANIDLPPLITVPPQNASVSVGASPTFSVTASGSPPLCYQWYCNGVAINRATNSSLVVSSVPLSDNGNVYSVAVRNAVGNTIGEADAEAFLTVADATKPVVNITNLVSNQTVSNAAFRVSGTASDNAGVAAVWYQLNNGAWTLASTTNGWTNWWADLALTTGTNTLRTYAVDIASHGFVYVADWNNSLIRKITQAGVVTTLAGDTYDLTNSYSNNGYADGTNSAAMFNNPGGVATDNSGNVYVADTYNNLIRKITPAGVVTTLAGDTNSLGSGGYADGTNGTAQFNYPYGVAVDASNNIYVADWGNNLIRKITPAGVVTTLAGDTNSLGSGGYADGTNGTAQFNGPGGVAVDASGNVYVADWYNNLIRKITPAGVVTTLAGDTNSLSGGYSDGTNGTALFNGPSGVVVDPAGNVFVADWNNNLIRKITPAGVVTTLAGDTYDLTNGGYNYTNNSGYADGTNGAVQFDAPSGVALDLLGNVYVSDVYNNLVRKITPAGVVTTLAGDTYDLTNYFDNGGYVDGTGSAAQFNQPIGVAVDNSGANVSVTNMVSFVYVVSATLTVSTNGLGSLNPNYNGAFLQIGQSYAITATAGTGFAFTNWTGGTSLPLTLLTNGSTVRFTMVTNLMLQANFIDTSKPTLSITNLTAGQRITTAGFTVKGTAGDNWQVSNVLCQVNGSGWNSATNINNWTNWAAGVTLVPGTNLVQAYAVDTSGNLSVTSSVSCQYVVTNQLGLQIVGLGTISPTNQLLEVGRNYSITATPASGFTFIKWMISTNWIGGTITNSPTVQFMMASNLTLQVTFADTTKPTLSVTNLTAGQRVSNAVFTVKGTAGDNWQVSNVLCQVNGGGWNSATNINNWTNWAAGVALVPGTNAVQAYALDTTGNLSPTSSVSFQYVVTNQLGVRAVGLGTINPNYSNAWLEIGRNYSIAASPANGFIATNWTISTNWLGGVKTNNATVQFMMTSNLTLLVTFADVTKPTLTVSSPTAGQHMTNALASLNGTASDNWQVAGVWCQLNSNAWMLVTTTNTYTNWSQTLTLVTGTNTIKAYAVDLGGNFSATNTLSVISSNTFQLQLKFTAALPLTSTGLNFSLLVSSNLNGHIQVSTNLLNWLTLTNFAGTNPTLNFRDPAATNSDRRFYRAVIP